MPDALSRLESLGPSPAVETPAPSESPPGTPLEALSRWLASLSVRPGMTLGPRVTPLMPAFTAYARAQGWDVEACPRDVGRAFTLAGCARSPGGGYRVARDVAAELWRLAGGRPPARPRRTPPKPKPPRVTRHPTKPLRACDGRMWRSQRDAMAALGVTALAISRAVHKGATVAGVHVRFATPDEVRQWRGEEWDGGIGSPS